MNAKVDLKGVRRGKLVVTQSGPRCLCVCDCGKEREVEKAYFLKGGALSCGCSSKANKAYRLRQQHMDEHPREYQSWVSMRDRCNPVPSQAKHHPHYVGVTICDRWDDFEKFYEDMGDRPLEQSLDRISPHKGYEPGNCKWSTAQEQSQNRKAWKHTPEGLDRINLNRRKS